MAWGARQLLRTGRILGLSLLIAADVITCWYMAYITLLFCCLLVLFELAVMIYDEDVRPSGKWIAGRAVRFTVAILLGMGLSAWTFVPTVLAMMGGVQRQQSGCSRHIRSPSSGVFFPPHGTSPTRPSFIRA